MANLSSKIQGVSQAAMPVITPWVSYTPTFGAGWGTVTGINFEWRQVGDTMEIRGNATTGTTSAASSSISIPSGHTIDSSAQNQIVGNSTTTVSGVSGTNNSALMFVPSGSTTTFALTNVGDGSTTKNLSTLNVNSVVGSTTAFSVKAAFPISGWESGTLQTANTYQVEYLYNSSSATGGDSSSFAYGANGGVVPNITQSLAGSVNSYRVRLASPLQSTDKVTLEFQINGSGPWLTPEEIANNVSPFSYNGGNYLGVYLVYVSSTDIDVKFGTAGAALTGTYASGTAGSYVTWGSHFSSGTRYRVRVVRGGIQGFGNATTTTPGLVTLAQLCPATGATAYTPTGNWVANTTYTGFWWRVADRIYCDVKALCSGAPTSTFFSASIPAGLTINTAVMANTATPAVLGQGVVVNSGVESMPVDVVYNTSTQVVAYYTGDLAGEENYLATVTQAVPFTVGANDYVHIQFSVPIAEWAGSLPGLVSDAQVEFAYNDSASTSSDTTSFATGTDGAAIANYAPVGTTAVSKRVRFANAVNASDQVIVEVQNGSGGWIPVSQSTFNFTTNDAGTTYYGVGLSQVNSTDFDVKFYSAPIANVGWSALSAWKWRVKKVKSSISALVDNATATTYGLVKGGKVPGATDGVAIAAGYVGETVVNQFNTAISTFSETTYLTATLDPGVWKIELTAFAVASASTTFTSAALNMYVDGVNTGIAGQDSLENDTEFSNGQLVPLGSLICPKNSSSSIPIVIKSLAVRSAGTGGLTLRGTFIATRIA